VKRVRVTVSGRVQGVFFRATCARLARDAGLGGYIRNLPDGRVEAAFEGAESAVDAIVDWCRLGPELALVEAAEAVDEDPIGDTTFRVSH
jgi:acylphosphatase